MTESRGNFWDERLGLSGIRSRLLERGIPAEVGWAHTLGSVSLALLAVLVVTGILLTVNYSPSTEHAYHSVRYIDHEARFGPLVRGLHYWAASFLVLAVGVHLLHSFWRFAFRCPREITWCTGACALVAVLAFAFTGYLLPWDEKAYWATVVGTNMVGQFPGVGGFLLRVVRGGEEVGAATLSRFYGAHVTILPFLLAVLVGLHLYLVVLHGIARKDAARSAPRAQGESWRSPVRGARPNNGSNRVPFWPNVMAMDAAAAFVVLAVLFVVAARSGAPLEAPADPTNTQYVPRPEWYFLPLFKLLTFFPGSWEPIAAVVIPLGSALVVLTVPWWAALLASSRAGQRVLVGGAGLAVAGVVALGIAAVAPPGAVELQVGGAKPRVWTLPPPEPRIARGRLLFEQLGCPNCHSVRGLGGVVGPDLTLVGLRRPDTAWLAAHLDDPRSIVPTSPMPPFPLEGERKSDLVAFLLSLGNDLRYTPRAPRLYAERCTACHRLGGEGGTYGPNLDRVGRVRTAAYVHQYVESPTSLNPDARMPPAAFGLSHEEVEDIARYVVATALGGPGAVQPGGPAERLQDHRSGGP